MHLLNKKNIYYNGSININGCECDYIFNSELFDIVITPRSNPLIDDEIIGRPFNCTFDCDVYGSDKRISFFGIYVYYGGGSKYVGSVEAFAIYVSIESNDKFSRIDFRGDCVDTTVLLYRACDIKLTEKSFKLSSLSDFSFEFSLSEHESLQFSYEYGVISSIENRSSQITYSGLETMIISNKLTSLNDLFAYYGKMIVANRIITNNTEASFDNSDFTILIEDGRMITGDIRYNQAPPRLKNNYNIYNKDVYIKGIECIFRETFNGGVAYSSFLRDKSGDVFTYERQFKLFAAFDHYYKRNCDCISFSEPSEMLSLKNDIIELLDQEKAKLGTSKKRKEYLKSIKRAIKNYDNSMSSIIKELLLNTFINNEDKAFAYSGRMNDYRNGIVHGHDFVKDDKGNDEPLNEISYWDFVIYQRLLLYIILYKYRNDFDLVTFCNQLYAS